MSHATVNYWQCPQDPDHIFEVDDWRVLPAQHAVIVYRWHMTPDAKCPYDGRELTRKNATVEVRP